MSFERMKEIAFRAIPYTETSIVCIGENVAIAEDVNLLYTSCMALCECEHGIGLHGLY